MLINEGALLWPTDPASAPAGVDPDVWDRALGESVEYLWGASGRQFGTRAAVYRPQGLLGDCRPDWATLYALTGLYSPLWGYTDDPARRFLLLPGPAVEVDEVQVVAATGNPVVLAPSAYRLDGNYLVRVDGQNWPDTQDLTASDGAANTWHVSYDRGNVVPRGGQIAAYLLAVEWAAKLGGGKSCLPWNVTTVTRAGVTINKDAAKLLTMTNIEAVDRWVNTVNPRGLAQPPQVWTPDVQRGGAPYAGSSWPYMSTVR